MQSVQVSQSQNYNPSFGVRYTQNTVKRLKEVTPDILRWTTNEQDYNLVKDAIGHLIHAGKRIDGYLIDLNDSYIRGFQRIKY